jgi:hypothetical protein
VAGRRALSPLLAARPQIRARWNVIRARREAAAALARGVNRCGAEDLVGQLFGVALCLLRVARLEVWSRRRQAQVAAPWLDKRAPL